MFTRRQFLKSSVAAGLAVGMQPRLNLLAAARDDAFAITPITKGPKQHWMGYYDKWQVDPTGRYAVGNEVELFFRSPTVEDVLNIGLIDLENGNAWKQIGTSPTWGWQQGCMLQWIPGPGQEVIWNDREGESFVSRIYNVKTGKVRTLPRAIYTLSPDGSFALCVDMDRLQFYRPGYGYPLITDRDLRAKAPADQGIHRMDLKTGESRLILSLAEIAGMHRPLGSVADYHHWFNHLLINPGGTRFIFLNRSRPVASMAEMDAFLREHPTWQRPGFTPHHLTRAMTAGVDGKDVYVLNDSGTFSHFIWKGDDVVTAWATTDDGGKAAFYEFRDRSRQHLMLDNEAMPENGHNTYVPRTNYEWILNDTAPAADDRKQTLYLYHVPTRRKVVLGRFFEPERFQGELRCDLHPRCDQQGSRVFFDSTHEGGLRQMYCVDIRAALHG